MSSNNISETGSSFEDRGKEEPTVLQTPLPTLEEQKAKIDQLAEDYGVKQKKLMLKLDLHIVPAICLLLFACFPGSCQHFQRECLRYVRGH